MRLEHALTPGHAYAERNARLPACEREQVLGLFDDRAHLGDAGIGRAELLEHRVRAPRQQPRQRRLAAAGDVVGDKY